MVALYYLYVADPFMGGGSPIIEANRVGCDVVGFDINSMSYWIVKQEIEHFDLVEYAEAADSLRSKLEESIGGFCRTRCGFCGADGAHVKYFIWVKKQVCDHCGKEFDLFPGYLLSADSRHTANAVVCGKCGELNEVEDRDIPGKCGCCSGELTVKGLAKRSRCQCPECGRDNRFPKKDMFNDRQLLALELSSQLVSETRDERVRNALATTTRGNVFTLKTLDRLVEHTELKKFKTKP